MPTWSELSYVGKGIVLESEDYWEAENAHDIKSRLSVMIRASGSLQRDRFYNYFPKGFCVAYV